MLHRQPASLRLPSAQTALAAEGGQVLGDTLTFHPGPPRAHQFR